MYFRSICKTGVAQKNGQGKINAACFLDFLNQKIVALLGAAGFS